MIKIKKRPGTFIIDVARNFGFLSRRFTPTNFYRCQCHITREVYISRSRYEKFEKIILAILIPPTSSLWPSLKKPFRSLTSRVRSGDGITASSSRFCRTSTNVTTTSHFFRTIFYLFLFRCGVTTGRFPSFYGRKSS